MDQKIELFSWKKNFFRRTQKMEETKKFVVLSKKKIESFPIYTNVFYMEISLIFAYIYIFFFWNILLKL